MRRGSLVAGIALAATAVLGFGQSASAATTVGNECAANTGTPGYTLVSLAAEAGNPLPNAIPGNGVVTSWTLNSKVEIPPEISLQQQLKILRPTGVAKEFQVVGESALVNVVSGKNSHPTRIPVQAGDLIGSTGVGHSSSETNQLVLFCGTSKPGDLIGAISGNPETGSTAPLALEPKEIALPITVNVEPDADNDGYGDETQDQCPTNASIQTACPTPTPPPAQPAPITLGASAVAKKGFVTVTLTASAQASVTVGGTVKLGKDATAKLGGGTQIVGPGTLAKFTIPFPGKLKQRLEHLTPKQKVTLSLAATAPGATTAAIEVKVKGQKKPVPRHHHA